LIHVREPTRADLIEAACRETTDWFVRANLLFHESKPRTAMDCAFCRPHAAAIRRAWRKMVEAA
jgi:hypothetical protein